MERQPRQHSTQRGGRAGVGLRPAAARRHPAGPQPNAAEASKERLDTQLTSFGEPTRNCLSSASRCGPGCSVTHPDPVCTSTCEPDMVL